MPDYLYPLPLTALCDELADLQRQLSDVEAENLPALEMDRQAVLDRIIGRRVRTPAGGGGTIADVTPDGTHLLARIDGDDAETGWHPDALTFT